MPIPPNLERLGILGTIVMKKKVKQWGNNVIISFSKEDQEAYDIKPGEIIHITITAKELNPAPGPPRPIT